MLERMPLKRRTASQSASHIITATQITKAGLLPYQYLPTEHCHRDRIEMLRGIGY